MTEHRWHLIEFYVNGGWWRCRCCHLVVLMSKLAFFLFFFFFCLSANGIRTQTLKTQWNKIQKEENIKIIAAKNCTKFVFFHHRLDLDCFSGHLVRFYFVPRFDDRITVAFIENKNYCRNQNN